MYALVLALEAVLIRGDEISYVQEEVFNPLRGPTLIRLVKRLHLRPHVDEESDAEVVSVFRPLE